MKFQTLLSLVLSLFFLANLGHAEPSSRPPGDATVYTVDTSSTNLPATYGAAANQYAASQSGKKNLCVVNGSATKIYGTTSATATCTGASNKFVVPASGSACYEYLKINTYVCLRSSSGTISSGVIDLVTW